MQVTEVQIEENPSAIYAQEIGLRYISDKGKGITRKRVKDSFVYLDLKGNTITDEKTLQRIKSLQKKR